ncbi:pirin family protein [Cyclobacterium amurskyense]|uniref:Pirin domain protein n=1 Tax=Cyclobacterium amurskyense TaxID=320787 RepID=A0A0H4PL90_9BACT|nr:pirin family protein [Cyclobacterium amurskyense]AKP53810.1 Pirin domain protein [Cyclobacterium amurskyense]
MSNLSLIIEERAASIGSFLVGRLLPFAQKRAVGPFVFIDHMGPVQLDKGQNLDVPPHPHIGLSTLTFLFEGSILHKDSLGTSVEVKPGEVNWMTAGKGVVHSERTPDYLRKVDKKLHGLQIWVALPKNLEQMPPSFSHISADEIPAWEQDGVQMKLIAGKAFGRKSPVPTYSDLYFLEIKSSKETTLNIGDDLFGESALYILSGEISSEGNTYGPKQLLVAKDSKICTFTIGENTTVYLFGGEPFPEERFIEWNFVSSDKELIKAAKLKWLNQTFPKVSGETDFVPLPQKGKF